MKSIKRMTWEVLFHDDFEPEFAKFNETVRLDLIAQLKVLERFGPSLGRPTVDTLKGAKTPNLKEIRFNSDSGVWRFLFAFDPERCAIVLCGADKTGVSSDLFYRKQMGKADKRYTWHLERMKENAQLKRGYGEPNRRSARAGKRKGYTPDKG